MAMHLLNMMKKAMHAVMYAYFNVGPWTHQGIANGIINQRRSQSAEEVTHTKGSLL